MDKDLRNGLADSGGPGFRDCPYQKTSHSNAKSHIQSFVFKLEGNNGLYLNAV